MSTQSFPFDFQRTPNFFSMFNNNFHLTDMTSSANNSFQLVFASYCPNNIEDCLIGNYLDPSEVIIADGGSAIVSCDLLWDNDDEVIYLRDEVKWTVETGNTPLQGVFLRDKNSQVVMGYSIHPNPFDVSNEVSIRANTVLWSFVDGN